jgi:hypothetical protein
MALDTDIQTRPADDGFERYFAEKIWEWIPEHYRDADGRQENPSRGTLRALIELIAGQAAVARRDTDRLWDDQHIATADDWVIPYIGDLLGTRPVSEQNRRGQRVAVARTIYYRRRKGTLPVLHDLIRDIGDLHGVVVEAFRRLGRTWHRLDKTPVAIGPITATPAGGTARLTSPRISDIVGGPFNDLAQTPDVRRLRGPYGRFNIPKINFGLYVQQAFPLRLVTPFSFGEGRFTLDPSGRDITLFQPRQRPLEDEPWRPVREWEVPAPVTCRRFNGAHYRIARLRVPTDLVAELGPIAGHTYRHLAGFRRALADRLTPLQIATDREEILDLALTPDSPRFNLWTEALSVAIGDASDAEPLGLHRVAGAHLGEWDADTFLAGSPGALIDPATGRMRIVGDLEDGDEVYVPLHHVGLVNPVGAGSFDRAAALLPSAELTSELDAAPFDEPGPVEVTLQTANEHGISTSRTLHPDSTEWALTGDLTLQAADGERPYFRFRPAAADPVVTIVNNGDEPVDLVLDGLWLCIQPDDLAAVPVDEDAPAPVVSARIVLDGLFGRVTLRHCTIDPGGEQARQSPTSAVSIPAVTLEVRGQAETILIDRCITGPVHEFTSTGDSCSARDIVICDSIVRALQPDVPAITSRIAAVALLRSTVFGDVLVNRLHASETLIQGLVSVTDLQNGCFRFSAADDRADKQVPQPFESHFIAPGIPNHWFVSRRFGDPGLAQLGPTVPIEIRKGGENRSEIGVFNRRLLPIRKEDLQGKVAEYLPFGLIAQFIEET